MSIREFAKEELTRAGLLSKDSAYDGELGKAVMDLVDVFAEQGHSGHSATMAISLFEQVARYKPLTPLTGEDDEWSDPDKDTPFLKNKRCPHVFKDKATGQAYDADGRIFREPSGICFTSRDSHVPVTFPYLPKREYVDVPAR